MITAAILFEEMPIVDISWMTKSELVEPLSPHIYGELKIELIHDLLLTTLFLNFLADARAANGRLINSTCQLIEFLTIFQEFSSSWTIKYESTLGLNTEALANGNGMVH